VIGMASPMTHDHLFDEAAQGAGRAVPRDRD
jgi:hypothetical protein